MRRWVLWAGFVLVGGACACGALAADKGQVLYDGMLSCVSNPREILECVGESGYEECVRCIIENN